MDKRIANTGTASICKPNMKNIIHRIVKVVGLRDFSVGLSS